MMNQPEDLDFPAIPEGELGLADHSEELEGRSDKDVRISFYQAMARINVDSPDVATRLSEAIASVLYDLCVIYALDPDGELTPIAAHDVNANLRSVIDDLDVATVVAERALFANDLEPHSRVELLRDGHRFVCKSDPQRGISAHSVLVVALRTTQGDPVGAMCIARHATTRQFSDTEVAMLEWIATDVAAKIETGRLHRNLTQKNAELSEKALALAEAVRERDDFISAASHELKTPISTLALQVALIRRQLGELPAHHAESIEHNVSAIERQVERLTRLVERLLDTTQLTDGELPLEYEALDLYALAQEVVQRFRPHAAQGRVELVLVGETMWVDLDADRLDQVLSNLLSNAVKYTRDGEVRLEIERTGDHAIIRVSDEGIGIPEDAHAQIFQRFERAPNARPRTGLGLGLWITDRIVTRLGGTIGLVSSPGHGSTFEVRIPFHRA